jgi:hypothetical protein
MGEEPFVSTRQDTVWAPILVDVEDKGIICSHKFIFLNRNTFKSNEIGSGDFRLREASGQFAS